MQTKTTRISFFDNLKFILILLVVVGHFIQYQLDSASAKGLFLFIYSFHMPLFIFVTGFFAKKSVNCDANKRMNKIINYLLLYLIYKVLLFVFYHYILQQPMQSFNLFSESEPAWYLLATAIWIMLMTITKNIKFKYLLIFSIIGSLLIGYDSTVTDQFALSRVIVFFPFFLLGYYLTFEQMNHLINKLHEKKKNIFIALVLIMAIFVVFILCGDNLYFLRGLLTGRNPFALMQIPFDIPLTGVILRMLWLLYNLIIAIIIFTLIPIKDTIFTKLGSRTLQIYVLHYFVIVGINFSFICPLIQNICGNYVLIFYILLGILTTIILSFKVFEKPFNKIMGINYKNLYK